MTQQCGQQQAGYGLKKRSKYYIKRIYCSFSQTPREKLELHTLVIWLLTHTFNSTGVTSLNQGEVQGKRSESYLHS